MSEVIGRVSEKKVLESVFRSERSEFVAIYGRRRVGKTYLIKNFFDTKDCIFFRTTGIHNGKLKDQLNRFVLEIAQLFYKRLNIKTPDSWLDAFDILTQALQSVPKRKKIVIFLDELPWLASRRSGLMGALEYFWNRFWSENDQIKLIVCGSVSSWIIKHIIKNRGGLHNRITRNIQLAPFNLAETHDYLKYMNYKCNPQQVAKIYMVTGGVPHYLKNFDIQQSIDQNIESLFFDTKGVFFNEFEEIFISLFEAAEQYTEIIKLIATVKEGISRSILEKKITFTGKGGHLTRKLEGLEQAGFISSYIPFGHRSRGQFYRITDEYCYFYMKWVSPIKNQLKQNQNANYWQSIINTPGYYSWLGYSFENLCYKHLPQIRKALRIDSASFASPWRSVMITQEIKSGAQIDLLFDRPDDAITICEIKNTENPFVIDKPYAKQLQNKLDVFARTTGTKKQLFLAIISANGLKETLYSEALINGGVVTLKDLFE